MREGSWPPKIGEMAPDYIPPEEREKRELTKEFNEVLSGKFDLIPEGAGFSSSLEGVQKMTIMAPRTKDQAHVWLKYESMSGRPGGATLTITKDGQLIGRLPEELSSLRREDILREALADLRAVDLDFWVQTDKEVAPPGDWPRSTEGREENGSEGQGGSGVLDLERLKFLQKQPGALFGHVTQKPGFKDYRVFFFKNFAIIEHPETVNAAYFIDFETPLPDELRRGAISNEQKKEIVQKMWPEELSISKNEMRKKGFTFIVHQGVWKEKMLEEIQKRHGGVGPESKA
ncbi:MAG: hypothetical protein RL272_1143 [Candidatus Parcubacteria bacterium]|jgi:hypothetical protein